ncbi:MAG TPA: hypothetical protein VGZ22_06875 [Isosphaeraceae bacterium]|jgi:hypothetical protein|nr:hypothetical protein [Isosphaeraceae bacterium]
MRTIHVDPHVTKIPSYDSAAKAIAAAMNSPRAKRSAEESPLIAGAFLTDLVVSDQRICLTLSNAHVLEIFPVDQVIEWRVTSCAVADSKSTAQEGGAVQLVWTNDDTSIWDPLLLLESRRGYPLHKLFGGEFFLNTHFKNGGILSFYPLWNQSDQRLMVYLSELEPPPMVLGA